MEWWKVDGSDKVFVLMSCRVGVGGYFGDVEIIFVWVGVEVCF